jgi:hypothetical protein
LLMSSVTPMIFLSLLYIGIHSKHLGLQFSWVLGVFHQGLFLWCNLGSDLLMLGRPGRMTLRRTLIRLWIQSYSIVYLCNRKNWTCQ